MKLLIADDETIIRRGLLGLDWKSVGVTEIQAVDNGVDALGYISQWGPDIILTDIRMTGMDGLQLAREVHLSERKCKIIILSGYGTFEYAREAMRNSVFEFLLKPSNPEEILAAVGRAAKELFAQDAHLSRKESSPEEKDDSVINIILEYIQENYMNEITLQSVSEYMHYSPSYLSKLIKKETTYNFTKILCLARMTKAAELLTGTNLKIYEICERIGMGDHRYFGQLFAKTFGQTPLEYRRMNRQRVETNLLDFIKKVK